jgi:hypothetical protein
MNKREALPYEAPRVVDYGDLQELTASCVGGAHGDSEVPGGILGNKGIGVSNPGGCVGP